MPFNFGSTGGGVLGARFGQMLSNPMLQMGLGMLAGNEGKTGDQAFRNSLGSGLDRAMEGQTQLSWINYQNAQRKAMEQEFAQRASMEEQRRQAAAAMQTQGYQGASLDEQQQVLSRYYPELAIKAAFQAQQPPPKRDRLQDASGRWRYTDDSRLVFPDVQTPSGEPGLSDVAALRKEYTSVSKPWTGVRDAYEKLEASQPTAAGDISLIFSYMKMLDPSSTVREGEAATVEQARGVPGTVLNFYNRIVGGQRLTPDQREEFLGQARQLMAAGLQHQVRRESQYRGIAERAKMNPPDAIRDLIGPTYRDVLDPQDTPSTPQSDADFAKLKSGALFIDPDDGMLYRKP